MLIMVDDDRLKLNPGEEPQTRKVRFRTLGCYPLTGALESDAESLEDIVGEIADRTPTSETGRGRSDSPVMSRLDGEKKKEATFDAESNAPDMAGGRAAYLNRRGKQRRCCGSSPRLRR